MLRGLARWVRVRAMATTTTTTLVLPIARPTLLLGPLPPLAVTRACPLPSASLLKPSGHRHLCSAAEAGTGEPATQLTEEEVTALVNQVADTLKERGMARHRLENVAKVFHLLLGLGVSAETISDQLIETPDLLDYSHRAWRETCRVLAEHGLPGLRILQHVATLPAILQAKPDLLNHNLLAYRQMNVGRQSMLTHVMRNPALCLTNPTKVRKKLVTLGSMFPQTEMKSLLKNNPNVLTDSWDDVMAKILYVHQEMGLEQPHIAASRCLRRPLVHLKARHLFLVRAGLYRRPNLAKDKQSHRRNPSLQSIMDTSDRDFANRVAKLSTPEYEVFKAMMVQDEAEIDEDGSSGSDSEGDDDDDDDDDVKEEEEEEDRRKGYRKRR